MRYGASYFVLFTKYLGDKIKDNEMGEACSTQGRVINSYEILVQHLKGKEPDTHSEDDIKTDLKGGE
jgi:hypothetical protein